MEGEPASLETYNSNIARGSGADLPSILGPQSMQDKDAVILLRKGKELIAFPGPGGYEIKWSPGTKLLPMIPAPSGHLVIPCDKFRELNKNRVKTNDITFITDHTTSSSSNPSASTVVD